MTNDTNSETLMTHVPMCHACGSAEVAAPFTTADGMGFCSAACEAEAQAEFAAWSDEQDADEPFDRDLRDDEAALESVYGPEDDGGYDDFNDWG